MCFVREVSRGQDTAKQPFSTKRIENNMKVIAINGSPRKNGNTQIVLESMAGELAAHDIETEIVQIGPGKIQGCIGCFKCQESLDALCVIDNDGINEVARRLREADGIILAAPTYYGGIPGSMKAYLDRLFFPSTEMMANKVSTAVVVHRRSGGDDALHQLHNYLRVNHTIIAPQKYWLIVNGLEIGEVRRDEEGMFNVAENAKSMAWLIRLIAANRGNIDPPKLAPRIATNFIREI